ncbi:late embryogenesis abundant family protein [Populus alba x Populus x berolinensis]|uniref:Late embryogenesis abundant family protein n=1 Tax=Populus alba x Populus x berolinensis TaxID=444605 RepID=A0AAD6WIH0_9ROSI|nr:late embryogenesis abundant family protein [Populus alba x Populus x berolinensis]
MNQCQEGLNQSTQDSSYTAQASSFIHQAQLLCSVFCFPMEQVKNMAQGAAEAVKNTLGMNTENTPTTNTSSLDDPIPSNPSNPSNPSTRI